MLDSDLKISILCSTSLLLTWKSSCLFLMNLKVWPSSTFQILICYLFIHNLVLSASIWLNLWTPPTYKHIERIACCFHVPSCVTPTPADMASFHNTLIISISIHSKEKSSWIWDSTFYSLNFSVVLLVYFQYWHPRLGLALLYCKNLTPCQESLHVIDIRCIQEEKAQHVWFQIINYK